MKKLILILLFATSFAQAETYKWIDNEGTVHFSDSPGEIPSYRKSTRSLSVDASNTSNTLNSATSGEPRQPADTNGAALGPRLDEMKGRMLQDDGTMDIIRSMQNDPEMQALLNNPEIMRAIQGGDIGALVNNPAFLKLLNNPRVREIEKRMQGGTK